MIKKMIVFVCEVVWRSWWLRWLVNAMAVLLHAKEDAGSRPLRHSTSLRPIIDIGNLVPNTGWARSKLISLLRRDAFVNRSRRRSSTSGGTLAEIEHTRSYQQPRLTPDCYFLGPVESVSVIVKVFAVGFTVTTGKFMVRRLYRLERQASSAGSSKIPESIPDISGRSCT